MAQGLSRGLARRCRATWGEGDIAHQANRTEAAEHATDETKKVQRGCSRQTREGTHCLSQEHKSKGDADEEPPAPGPQVALLRRGVEPDDAGHTRQRKNKMMKLQLSHGTPPLREDSQPACGQM